MVKQQYNIMEIYRDPTTFPYEVSCSNKIPNFDIYCSMALWAIIQLYRCVAVYLSGTTTSSLQLDRLYTIVTQKSPHSKLQQKQLLKALSPVAHKRYFLSWIPEAQEDDFQQEYSAPSTLVNYSVLILSCIDQQIATNMSLFCGHCIIDHRLMSPM